VTPLFLLDIQFVQIDHEQCLFFRVKMKGLAAAVLALGVTRTIAQGVVIVTSSINTGSCAPVGNAGPGGSGVGGSGTGGPASGVATSDDIPYESNVYDPLMMSHRSGGCKLTTEPLLVRTLVNQPRANTGHTNLTASSIYRLVAPYSTVQ